MVKSGSTCRWYQRINVPLWAALATTLLCALIYLGHRASYWSIPGIEDWERSTGDIRFRLRGPRARIDDRVEIVALDNETRRRGPVLWQTRRGFTTSLNKLTESKLRAVGIDAFFSSPEINLSQKAIAAIRDAAQKLSAEADLSPGGVAAHSARQPSRALPPLRKIGEVVAHMRHVNVRHDADGAVREAPSSWNEPGATTRASH